MRKPITRAGYIAIIYAIGMLLFRAAQAFGVPDGEKSPPNSAPTFVGRIAAPAGSYLLFSADGKRMISSWNESVAVIDVGTLHVLSSFDAPDGISRMTVSRDFRRILTMDVGWNHAVLERGSAILWDAESGKALLPHIQHGEGLLTQAELAPDGTFIATGVGTSSIVHILDSKDGKQLSTFDSGSTVKYLAMFGDNKLLVCGVESARVWNPKSGLPITPAMRMAHHYEVEIMPLISADGNTLILAEDKTFTAFDLRNGRRIADSSSDPLPLDVSIAKMAVSANGGRVVIASMPGLASRVWDAKAGSPLIPEVNDYGDPCISPDGQYLMIGKTRCVYRIENGKLVTFFSPEHPLFDSACFSPDGTMLALGYDRGHVDLWSLRQKKL